MKKLSILAFALGLIAFTACSEKKARAFFSEHAVKAISPKANARIDNFFIIFIFYMLIIMLI